MLEQHGGFADNVEKINLPQVPVNLIDSRYRYILESTWVFTQVHRQLER